MIEAWRKLRRVRRYQRGKHNTYIEEDRQRNDQKKKVQKDILVFCLT